VVNFFLFFFIHRDIIHLLSFYQLSYFLIARYPSIRSPRSTIWSIIRLAFFSKVQCRDAIAAEYFHHFPPIAVKYHFHLQLAMIYLILHRKSTTKSYISCCRENKLHILQHRQTVKAIGNQIDIRYRRSSIHEI
jgi:hypothetical protein